MEKLKGKTEIKINGQGSSVSIIKLFPYNEDESMIELKHIQALLHSNNVIYGIDEKLIEYYIKMSVLENKAYSEIVIAQSKMPVKKGSGVLKFTKSPYSYDEISKWNFFDRLLKEYKTELSETPYSLVYHNKDEVIATLSPANDNIPGKSVIGEDTIPGRFVASSFNAGENVRFDESKNAFIAGVCGYLLVKDSTLSILPPFIVSPDKMQLLYYNFKKIINEHPKESDIISYLNKNKISETYLKTKNLSDSEVNSIRVVAEGLMPEDSIDATVELYFSTSNKIVEKGENDIIDFREILSFSDVKENEVLAIKKNPFKGNNGEDIFGGIIPSRNPKDAVIKCGLNTFKEETDYEMKVISKSDGIIEYKNSIISVFPQLRFNSDIDYGTGNIHAKVNVYISGNIRTGFKVQSEKNIFINGSIEDNCLIEAGGDIYVQNGASGSNTHLNAGGDLSIKFVEGCKLTAKGNINVQRFILGSEVECGDTITVMGSGINLNEKGAIIDCDIKVKNTLIVPSIGNDSGTKSNITFAYDTALYTKISNLQEAIDKLKEQIQVINDNYEVDITSPTIHAIIKNFAKSVKDDIIAAIQEKNKLEQKMNMMQNMLNKETEIKEILLRRSSVQITRKVFPPLILECDGTNKVVDTIQPPSKYYLDIETHWIERSRYGG